MVSLNGNELLNYAVLSTSTSKETMVGQAPGVFLLRDMNVAHKGFIGPMARNLHDADRGDSGHKRIGGKTSTGRVAGNEFRFG